VCEVVFSRIVVFVALAVGVGFAGVSAAETPPSHAPDTAWISHLSAGTVAGVTIGWNASCDPPAGDSDPQDWSWSVLVRGNYADGHDAFDSGYVGPTIGATTWNSQQTFAIEFEHEQDQSETISWKAILACGSNQGAPYTLGSGTFTIRRSSGGGSGGGGSGSGGGGSGSGGTGTGSHGPGCVVPKLVGKTLAVARKLLKHAHCKLGRVTGPKASRGVVLVVRRSSPRAGTHLRDGAKVDVKTRKA
jgi:PASTA domain